MEQPTLSLTRSSAAIPTCHGRARSSLDCLHVRPWTFFASALLPAMTFPIVPGVFLPPLASLPTIANRDVAAARLSAKIFAPLCYNCRDWCTNNCEGWRRVQAANRGRGETQKVGGMGIVVVGSKEEGIKEGIREEDVGEDLYEVPCEVRSLFAD